jgi:hypothetical protein
MALIQEGALPLIQLAVTPVILITGLGSLLLTMTNRLGRVVDRTRILAGQVRTADMAERSHLRTQLRIMYRRARLVRLAVTLAATSMFISGLLVVVIFLSALLGKEFSDVIVGLFVTAVLFLLASLAVLSGTFFFRSSRWEARWIVFCRNFPTPLRSLRASPIRVQPSPCRRTLPPPL